MDLEANVRLYPVVKVRGQSFKGVKSCVVPRQSMSLREIVQRFVRRESLPISKEGYYEDRFGDLEKIARMDITEQMERVAKLKEQIAAFNVREKERKAKEAKDAVDKLEAEKQDFERRIAEAIKAREGKPDQIPTPKGS